MLEQQYDRLPEPQRVIVSRLAARWLSGAAVDQQIDGAETLVSTLSRVMENIIGSTGTRATKNRALFLAGQRIDSLGRVVGRGRGLDMAVLREELRATGPNESRETIESLVVEWVAVLHWLLAGTLLPLLEEAEAELNAMEDPGDGKEGQ